MSRSVTGFSLAMFVLVAGCSRQPSAETSGKRSDSATSARTDSAVASLNLRGPDWRLVAVGDKPVTVADSQRTPHMALRPDSKQVNGSGGCNRMFGVYELNGDSLRFSGVGSTKMACIDGMDTEGAFFAALLRVAKWKVTGKTLELSDSAGALLAKFEAR